MVTAHGYMISVYDGCINHVILAYDSCTKADNISYVIVDVLLISILFVISACGNSI